MKKYILMMRSSGQFDTLFVRYVNWNDLVIGFTHDEDDAVEFISNKQVVAFIYDLKHRFGVDVIPRVVLV